MCWKRVRRWHFILLAAVLLAAIPAPAGCGDEEGEDPAAEAPSAVATDARDDSGADEVEAAGAIAAARIAPPTSPVKLVFIHHSVGEEWLSDEGGQLGLTLMANNYFVSDTNYGWCPTDDAEAIGDTTDIGDWYNWFAGPDSDSYLAGLYRESGQHSDYSRLADDPGGENTIVMFKSCFPNSGLGGAPDDPPTTGDNPLRGRDAGSEAHTVANAKGIYNDLLGYFATRTDKLFVVVTAPPLAKGDTDAGQAANARAFNDWLVNEWRDGYEHDNVLVFDFFNVLTSNGGSPENDDLGSAGGNHHRYYGGAVEHVTGTASDFSAYAWEGDSHPTAAGGRKASSEFIDLLNLAYAEWSGRGSG